MSQNNNYPICTILCPVYNKENYLRRCFDSILKQKTKYKYKVITIDDKSTDNSAEILQEYANKYPDLFYFYQNDKNMKTLATSIRGYELIDTKYYCVLDADDFWESDDFLEDAINFLENHNEYALYSTNTYLQDENHNRTPLLNHSLSSETFSIDDTFFYSHTSASIFKNTFASDIISKLKTYIGTEAERVYEGDTFRNMLALNSGLAFLDNRCKTVYNYNGKGIWSKLEEEQQEYINALLWLEFYKFFNKKHIILLKNAAGTFKNFFDNKIPQTQKLNSLYKEFLELEKDANILLFKKSSGFNFIQQIFSVKNVDGSKIITIFGFEFIFKNKKGE